MYNKYTRTTCAAEAYNGVLNKKLVKKGHFFKFVQVMQEQEFAKSREMTLLVNSGGADATSKPKRRKVKVILKIIMLQMFF